MFSDYRAKCVMRSLVRKSSLVLAQCFTAPAAACSESCRSRNGYGHAHCSVSTCQPVPNRPMCKLHVGLAVVTLGRIRFPVEFYVGIVLERLEHYIGADTTLIPIPRLV